MNAPVCRVALAPRHNHHGQHVRVGEPNIGSAIRALDTAAAAAIRERGADVRPMLARANDAVSRYLDGATTVLDAIATLDAVCAELRGGAA